MKRLTTLVTALLLLAIAGQLQAQNKDVPYWASISASVVNMRVGPGTSYRIEWVYKREGLPLRVVRREEGWRLVEDPEGTRGWMLGQFLSRERGGIVTGKALAEMRDKTGQGGGLAWQLEPGVVGKLGQCQAGWCKFEIGRRKGVVPEDRLWGTGEP